jgi:hypothetical protein
VYESVGQELANRFLEQQSLLKQRFKTDGKQTVRHKIISRKKDTVSALW